MRALLSLLFAFQAPAAAPAGKVISITGLVSLEPGHVNLAEGSELSEGDHVTVMAKAKLRLKLVNGALVEVGPNSDLTFKRSAHGVPFLRLPHGSLLTVAQNPTPLDVHSGQIHVRLEGRAFYFEPRLDQSAYLCVCDGKAKAQWHGGLAKVGGHKHHFGVILNLDHSSPERGPVKPIGHSDADLKSLRALLL